MELGARAKESSHFELERKRLMIVALGAEKYWWCIRLRVTFAARGWNRRGIHRKTRSVGRIDTTNHSRAEDIRRRCSDGGVSSSGRQGGCRRADVTHRPRTHSCRRNLSKRMPATRNGAEQLASTTATTRAVRAASDGRLLGDSGTATN